MSEDIKVTKGIEPAVGFPKYVELAKNNSAFCNRLINKTPMPIIVDDNTQGNINKRALIYDVSGKDSLTQSTLQSIIDLLMQLRASQSDQNVFIQNNTVVREQILSQLKNELLNVKNNLNQGQIKKLELISSNSFDEKTLNELLKSLLEESKKKSPLDEPVRLGNKYRNIEENLNVFSNISRSYNRFVNLQNKYKNVMKTVSQGEILERSFRERRLVNIRKILKVPEPESLSGKKSVSGTDAVRGEILDKTTDHRQILRVSEIFAKVRKEKDVLSRYTDLFKVKLATLNIQRSLESRNLGYFIHGYGKKKFEKSTIISENKIFSERLGAKLKFLKVKNIKETEEEREHAISEVSVLKRQTKETRKKIGQNLILTNEMLKSVSEDRLVNKNISVIQNKVIDKTINKEQTEKLRFKSKFVNNYKKKYDKLTQKYYRAEKLNKIFLDTVNKTRVKSHLTDISEIERLKLTKQEIQNDIINKYRINTTDFSEKTSLSRVIDNVNLIRKKAENRFKIEEIENQIQETHKKVSKLEIGRKKTYKILREFDTETIIKDAPKNYNEVLNRYKKLVTKTDGIYQKSKAINVTEILSKRILSNTNLKERENLIRKLSTFNIQDKNLITQREIEERTNIILKKSSVTGEINKDINLTNQKEILARLTKLNINRLNTILQEKKNVTLTTENIFKDNIRKLNKKQTTTKNLIDIIHDEKFIDMSVEKGRTIIAKRPPVINHSDVDLLVKTTSQEIINKTLTTQKLKKTRRSIIDEKNLFDMKNRSEKLTKSPLIIKERIRSVKKIENEIYEKISSTIPARVRELNKTLTRERTLYREVEEAKRSYFDNLRENLEERILINRQKVSSLENVHREIERNAVVYKKPLNLKTIIESSDKEKGKEQKPFKTLRPERISGEKQTEYVPKVKREIQGPQVKGLTRDEVLNMIQSYVGKVDIGLISDKVMKRVEGEMLSQRRRSGII